ncbi:S8 family serine peptidase [Silanimonas sp.]|uniref:S8 family serine peptidase n=1 Tax=Silanimonas sp. TaxID=1929290 RepID=UPI0022BB3BBC|nr:S8 family serine peptidase [Silanimonas sp.]MCZ8116273.1 S8 family serine peptidase [Silanimonas sp.]
MNRKSFKPHALAAALIVAMAPMGAAVAADGARIVNKAAVESGAEFSGFIVKFRDGTAQRANAAMVARSLQGANAVMAKSSRGAAGLRHFRRMSLGADVIRASRALSSAEAVQAMQQLAAMPGVEYVEPDLIMHPALTPNDTRYNEQWGFFDADAGIRANTAWDVATGTGIIVAVLDTGQATHSDITGNLVAGYDFITSTTVSGDGNGRDSDPSDPGDFSGGQNSSWHGTHVAGTVAARTNNGAGVAGTAFNAKVMPVRVLGRGGGSTSDIADAIIWASGGTVSGVPTLSASQKAHVINMSLGGSGSCGTTTQNAINGAVSRGTTVVVAAGNSNANASGFTPASCANVINVASVTSASARSSFSNYGTLIDVSAPGSSILSTLNAGTTTPGAESYASYSGTSMASPHVAGTVALVQSRRLALGLPLYTPAEVESLLKTTAYALAGACSGGCGAGIIDAKRAVDAAGGGGGGGGTPPTTQTYANEADFAIRDNTTINSPITVSGRSGNAPSTASVSVDILHTYRGDLLVQLVAPDGSLYTISNRAGGSADNLIGTYTINLSSELLNGTWNLRVNDNARGDTGTLRRWTITF